MLDIQQHPKFFTICPSHTSQRAAASPTFAIDSMKVSWYVANVLVTIGTGCRAQAAVYRTNRKGSRSSEFEKSLLPLWNIDVRRFGRRRQIHRHWSEGRQFSTLGVDGKGSMTRKRFCLSSLISWCFSCWKPYRPMPGCPVIKIIVRPNLQSRFCIVGDAVFFANEEDVDKRRI